MPANLSHKDLLNIKKDNFDCSRLYNNGVLTCSAIGGCQICMIDEQNKVYFDHWFKNQYKGERLKKGKMTIMFEGKKL
jgi:hypothetical protein